MIQVCIRRWCRDWRPADARDGFRKGDLVPHAGRKTILGYVNTEAEAVAMIKTTRGRLEELEAWLQTHHPYEVPETLILIPEAGSARYFQWVRESVAGMDETAVDNAGS